MTQTEMFCAPATVAPPLRPSSIRTHEIWERLRPFVSVEMCSTGDSKKHRFRLELRGVPPPLMREALAAVVSCAECSRPITPVRMRKAPNKRSDTIGQGAYLGLTCALNVNVSCSRSRRARDAYQAIRADLEADR